MSNMQQRIKEKHIKYLEEELARSENDRRTKQQELADIGIKHQAKMNDLEEELARSENDRRNKQKQLDELGIKHQAEIDAKDAAHKKAQAEARSQIHRGQHAQIQLILRIEVATHDLDVLKRKLHAQLGIADGDKAALAAMHKMIDEKTAAIAAKKKALDETTAAIAACQHQLEIERDIGAELRKQIAATKVAPTAAAAKSSPASNPAEPGCQE